MAHCQEYISTVNVLASAFDADLLPAKVSTKDFRAVPEPLSVLRVDGWDIGTG